MNVLSRYSMMADRSARAGAMDDIGGPRNGGAAGLGGEPILMGYQGGAEPPANPFSTQPSAPQAQGGDIDGQMTHMLMTRAKTREEAEAMLRDFAQDSGDAGLEAIDRIAKQLGLRTPWHRDFSAPPAQIPGAQMGPSGLPRPRSRMDY